MTGLEVVPVPRPGGRVTPDVLIGELSATPKACGDEHLPGCFNTDLNRTWCICGEQTWEGDEGSWHSRTLYDSAGQGAKVTGYDVYFMAAIS